MMTTIRVLLVAMILIAAVEYKSSEGEEMAGRGGAIAPSAVYRIICIDRKTGGTGFGHRSGRILTAAHVVEGCDLSKIIVIAYPNVTTTVSAIVADSTIDLALLTPSAADFVKHSFPIWTGDDITLGAQVSTWGFPEGYTGQAPLLSVGYLAGAADINGIRKWTINAAFNNGNSGGPLLETNTATVIGVISSKSAPIQRDIEADLKELQKNGSAQEKRIARILTHQRNQTQLVIGFATVANHLRDFLRKNRIEP
jgi:S1-C subfamily serine protease